METRQLIKPVPGKHEYVIGIDFGHGETSASYCRLDWNNNSASPVKQLELNGSEKVVVSAICRTTDGEYHIGNDIFDSQFYTNRTAVRIGFKEPPASIEGQHEQLMIQFMRLVYERIRRAVTALSDDNHVVYMARPSGWHDDHVKRVYEQMALHAGIPLAGLTAESRAAFYKAMTNPEYKFGPMVKNGAIVVDLGSSTLDFTYLSEREQNPIDHGYPCGASLIDNVIYDDQIKNHPNVAAALAKYPDLEDIFRYQARQIKEKIYTNEKALLNYPFDVGTITNDEEFEDKNCRVKYAANMASETAVPAERRSLNQAIEDDIQYMSKIKEAMEDFDTRYVRSRPVSGVFLTGGASRMGFMLQLVEERYRCRCCRDSEPSLVVSDGTTMLGAADALSRRMRDEILREADGIMSALDKFDWEKELSAELTAKIWDECIYESLQEYANNESDWSFNDLMRMINARVEQKILNNLPQIIQQKQAGLIEKSLTEVNEKATQIIRFYSPEKTVDFKMNGGSIQTDEINSVLQNSIEESVSRSLKTVMDGLTDWLSILMWMAIGGAFGLIGIAVTLIGEWWLGDDKEAAKRKQEEKNKSKRLSRNNRQKVYAEVMKQQDDIVEKIEENIYPELKGLRLNEMLSRQAQALKNEVMKTIDQTQINID